MDRLLIDVCDTYEEAMQVAGATEGKTEIIYSPNGTYQVYSAKETKREKVLREMLEKVRYLQEEAYKYQKQGNTNMVDIIFGKITDLYKDFYKEWM